MSIRLAAVSLILAGAACYSPDIGNGKLKCSTKGVCPDGFYCAADGTCWKKGSTPPTPMPDLAQLPMPDMAQPPRDMAKALDAGGVAPRTATSVLSGGVTAKSEHYKVIMSTGQAPGGNGNAASPTKKVRSGVPGATQGK